MAQVTSDAPLFVIAIGGTGMRCLESFVHLCAIGMFDNKKINILTLDTDANNGNKERVEQLVENYIRIKKGNGKDYGTPNVNTFFSAAIRLYKYATNYDEDSRNSYKNLAYSSATAVDDSTKQQNQDLADLFLDHDSVQEFNLSHGYRAQTHLGSLLMYHSIVESAKNRALGIEGRNKELDENLCQYLDELSVAKNPRVFVFGSVFGGTGASSIPVIPVAFRDAVQVMATIKGGSASLDLNETKFGASLLTDYFSFRAPTAEQKKEKGNQVIADSNNFALNSQAALQFYQDDPTVKLVYKHLYTIGWPQSAAKVGNEQGKTQTGGNNQKNNCHVVELMCACAAYDFFTANEEELGGEVKFLYRSPAFEEVYKFTGKDFVGEQRGDMFTNKLGAFLSFSHVVLNYFNGGFTGTSSGEGSENGVKRFIEFLQTQQDVHDYDLNDNWTDSDTEQINKYLRFFAYQYSASGTEKSLIPGWLFQIYNSVGSGQFLFKSTAFQHDKILKNQAVDAGDIFLDDLHNWNPKGGGILSFNNSSTPKKSFDKLGECLKDPKAKDFSRQNVTTTEEKFLAHIYNAITIAQHFN